MLKLTQLSKHVWLTDFEEYRDRPSLGYIHTEHHSIAIDAGHSQEHVQEFYEALTQAQLPLPKLTIITHYHWDHTFGMHAVHGKTMAEANTQQHLQDILNHWNQFGENEFKKMDVHIHAEYEHQSMQVVLADEVFTNQTTLHFDELDVQCFHVVSSHTNDATLIYIPQEKILFFGDAMCGEYPEWIIHPQQMKAFISEIEKIDFDVAVGGHWKPFTKTELLKTLYNDLNDSL